jgi:hypothetical protein
MSQNKKPFWISSIVVFLLRMHIVLGFIPSATTMTKEQYPVPIIIKATQNLT